MSAIEFRAARFDEFPHGAALRQEMSVEMGGNFDALAPDWRAKFCQYFGGKQAAGNSRRLMELAIGWARERSCTRVRLRASDDGRLLYQTLGFAAGREMELSL